MGPLLKRLGDADIPALVGALFADLAEEHAALCAPIAEIDRRLRAWHKASELSRRLAAIPGVGSLIASLLVMKTPEPRLFASGRDYAAWLGLTPRDHSTAGKARPGRITRAGDPDTAQPNRRRRHRGDLADAARHREKPLRMGAGAARAQPAKLAAVALANKMARIA